MSNEHAYDAILTPAGWTRAAPPKCKRSARSWPP